MSAGRKTLMVQAVPEIELDQAKIDGAVVAMRDYAQEEQLELLELAGDVGALRALEMTRSLVAVATIRIFQKVCESKQINKLPIRLANGSVATATNIDEFCRLAFNKPRSAMFEASATLEVLGDQAYEAANRLGLNRKQLRLIRAMPDVQRTAVAEAIASESKPEVIAIIEDLAAQLSEAQETIVDAKAELVAADKIISVKSEKIDRMSRHIAKSTPDTVLLELQKEATSLMNDALGCVRGQIRQAFIAIKGHTEADHSIFMAGLLGQLQADVAALRDEFNLPDVSTARDQELAAEVAQWAPPTKPATVVDAEWKFPTTTA